MGTIVNTIAILVGTGLGLFAKKGISNRFSDHITKGVALCILLFGIQGAIKNSQAIVLIFCMVLGGILGEWMDLEKRMRDFAQWVQLRFSHKDPQVNLADGFVAGMMIFCVGAMAIVGSLQSGLSGDNNMLYTKSVLDGVIAVILTASHGVGVGLSAFAILVYQGSITLLASVIAQFLTDDVIANMASCGNLLLLGLGLNMLGITKLKVMNYVPAVFIPIILLPLMAWLGFA